jgi:hypothetical protein
MEPEIRKCGKTSNGNERIQTLYFNDQGKVTKIVFSFLDPSKEVYTGWTKMLAYPIEREEAIAKYSSASFWRL